MRCVSHAEHVGNDFQFLEDSRHISFSLMVAIRNPSERVWKALCQYVIARLVAGLSLQNTERTAHNRAELLLALGSSSVYSIAFASLDGSFCFPPRLAGWVCNFIEGYDEQTRRDVACGEDRQNGQV